MLGGSILIDHHYEMTGRLGRAAWALRENLSFYDPIYVVVAQALAAPLLTCDALLSREPDPPCAVELVGAA
jgi:predicted nucleic acid-binding protein